MIDKEIGLTLGEYIVMGTDLVFVDTDGCLHYSIGNGIDMGRYTTIKVVPVLDGLLEYLGGESITGKRVVGFKEVSLTEIGVLVVADKSVYTKGGNLLDDLEQVLEEYVGYDVATSYIQQGVWVEFK